jgi:putative addiction module CopG family antidote
VVREALRLMEQQDQLRLLQFEQLRRDIQDGLASGEAEVWNS